MSLNTPIIDTRGTVMVPEARGLDFPTYKPPSRQTVADVKSLEAEERGLQKDVGQQELQLNEIQMAQGFRELLKTGLQGAQAYVQEVSQIDPNVGAQAEAQLQMLTPLFSDPKLSGQHAQSALENFYQSVDTKLKLANEPDWFDKQKQKHEDSLAEAKYKSGLKDVQTKKKRRSESEIARSAYRKSLGSMEDIGRGLLKEKPVIGDYIPELKAEEFTEEKITQRLEEAKKAQEEYSKTLRGRVWAKGEKAQKYKAEVDKLESMLSQLQKGSLKLEDMAEDYDFEAAEKFTEKMEEWQDKFDKQLAKINKIRTEKKLGFTQLTEETLGARTPDIIGKEIDERFAIQPVTGKTESSRKLQVLEKERANFANKTSLTPEEQTKYKVKTVEELLQKIDNAITLFRGRGVQ